MRRYDHDRQFLKALIFRLASALAGFEGAGLGHMSTMREVRDGAKVGSDFAMGPQPAPAIARLTPSGSETHDEAVRTLTPGSSASGVIDFAGDTDAVCNVAVR